MDRKEFSSPINADIVKKYYAWGNEGNDLSKLKTRKDDCGEWGKNLKKRKEQSS